jgi:acetyl-CoA acetyltransferase
MKAATRGTTAVVGAAYAGVGTSPGWSSLELLGSAAKRALDDAGLKLSDVDGLCAATFYHFFPTLSAAEYLGIQPKWSNSDTVGGSSFMSHVAQATLAINAGLCEVVLIAYGSNARSSRNLNGLIETPDLERPYDPMVPVSGYSLAASRYFHEYGATRRDLANVVLSARKWAALNPDAELRNEISMEEILAAPLIASPFSKYDCCLVSDGGAAIVVTSAERARHLKKKPIYVLGSAAAHSHREIAQMPDFTVTCASVTGPEAMKAAGVTHKDIGVAQLYDAFTLNPILFLEDLGFCKKGEGAAFIAAGNTRPGGSLPVNTNGGGLCFAHPGAYGLFCLIEAVTQLRGEGGARQVAGAEVALAHGNGGTLSHQATTILGTEACLG